MRSRQRRGGGRMLAGFAAVAIVAGVARTGFAFGWTLVDAKIRHDFPEVKRITTVELSIWLDDKTRPAPVLLDVRTRAEYNVSHLAGARQVEPDASASEIHLGKDQPIVTYCSVGYRSGAFAKKLSEAGYMRAVNLEGSIFRWANEGRPVFRGTERVAQVHPYNRTWGLLLHKQLRAEVASTAR